jgi:L-threonylcarbamoyladenylate synthase
VESTVLDLTEDPPVLLRPGGVPWETLEAVIGHIRVPETDNQASRRSPGTRYRHYAPQAQLLLALPGEVEPIAARLVMEGRRVGVMTQRPFSMESPNLIMRAMLLQPEGYARELFAALRELDALKCEVIVAETVDEQGLGRAVMDRLRRAASSTESARASSRRQITNVEEKTLHG